MTCQVKFFDSSQAEISDQSEQFPLCLLFREEAHKLSDLCTEQGDGKFSNYFSSHSIIVILCGKNCIFMIILIHYLLPVILSTPIRSTLAIISVFYEHYFHLAYAIKIKTMSSKNSLCTARYLKY